jgi:prevent-host-death family protein
VLWPQCGYNGFVIRLGVRELKNGLSSALRQVEDGETVEVTDHGRPIARIVSIRPTLVEQLIVEGRMTLPEEDGDLLALGPPPPLEPGEMTGSEILTKLRADER